MVLVITPAANVIKEVDRGAFPRVVLSEGEYITGAPPRTQAGCSDARSTSSPVSIGEVGGGGALKIARTDPKSKYRLNRIIFVLGIWGVA